MTLEYRIFERDDSCERCLKTAPYVYYLLVDRENMFYFGGVLGGFYYQAPYHDTKSHYLLTFRKFFPNRFVQDYPKELLDIHENH
jgi:hypothetical protein